jgi:hypothetical protein
MMSADHVGAASQKPIDLVQISRLSHAGKSQHEDGAWMPLPANQSRYRAFDAGFKQGSCILEEFCSSRVRRPLWCRLHEEEEEEEEEQSGLEERKSNLVRVSSSRTFEHVQRVADPACPQMIMNCRHMSVCLKLGGTSHIRSCKTAQTGRPYVRNKYALIRWKSSRCRLLSSLLPTAIRRKAESCRRSSCSCSCAFKHMTTLCDLITPLYELFHAQKIVQNRDQVKIRGGLHRHLSGASLHSKCWIVDAPNFVVALSCITATPIS